MVNERGGRGSLECVVERRSDPRAADERFRVSLDGEVSKVEVFGRRVSISCLARPGDGMRLLLECDANRWEVAGTAKQPKVGVDLFGFGPKLDSTLMLNGVEIARMATIGRWYAMRCTFSSGRSCVVRVTGGSGAGEIVRNWIRLLTFRWRSLVAVSPLISRPSRGDAPTDEEAWSAAVAALLLRLFGVDHDPE